MDENKAGLRVEDVREQVDELLEAVRASFSAVLGDGIEVGSCGVDASDGVGVVDSETPVLHALSTCSDGVPLHAIAGREEASMLAGLQLGNEREEIELAAKEALDGEFRAAFQAVAKSVLKAACDVLGDAAPKEISVQDVREVETPASDPTWLDPGSFVRLRLGLRWEGKDDASLLVLLPGVGESVSMGSSDNLIFLETSADEFDLIEVLGNALSCDVSVEQPDIFMESVDAELRDATIIIPWDLAGRSGLELAEVLHADVRLEGMRIVMSCGTPTRDQVAAALRAGATTFLHKPYSQDEIEDRLIGAPVASEVRKSEESADDAGPASNDESAGE